MTQGSAIDEAGSYLKAMLVRAGVEFILPAALTPVEVRIAQEQV